MNAGLLQISIKCMNITITVFYINLTKLVLCLMLLATHYAQYYAGTIGGSLGGT